MANDFGTGGFGGGAGAVTTPNFRKSMLNAAKGKDEENPFDITQTAKDDKDAALTNLRTLIAQGRLCIHPRCVHTIACLRGGRWNNNRTDWLRTPDLGHCDALAAVIYAARNLDTRNPLPLIGDNGIHAQLRGIDKNKSGFKKLNNMWGGK
jgi:hypothetical protein